MSPWLFHRQTDRSHRTMQFLLLLYCYCICATTSTNIEEESLHLTGPPSIGFGNSVRLNDEIVVVGSPYADEDNVTDVGSLKIYSKSDGLPRGSCCRREIGNGTAGDKMGYAVALDGTHLVVSSIHGDGRQSGGHEGGVYVYEYETKTWHASIAFIYADDGKSYDEFGSSVAVHDNTIVVGARYNDAAGNNSGAAYVFARNGNEWRQSQKLVPSQLSAQELIGICVRISGKHLIVVGNRAVYIFRKDFLGSWVERKVLQPPYLSTSSLRNNVDVFDTIVGGSVESRIVVGVDKGGDGEGEVYVYLLHFGDWTLESTLTASDGIDGNHFGVSVAIDHRTLIVGAYKGSGSDHGRAYTFELINGTWTEVVMFSSSPNDVSRHFGTSVDVVNGVVAVGWSETSTSATVHVFDVLQDFVVYCNESEVTGVWRKGQFNGEKIEIVLNDRHDDQQCNDFTGSNLTHVWVTSSLDACGTVSEQQTSGVYLINKATITVTKIKYDFLSRRPVAEQSSYEEFDMMCKFNAEQELVTNFVNNEYQEVVIVPLPTPHPNMTATETPRGEFNATMKIYTNKFYVEEVTWERRISSGEPIYIGISDPNRNPNFKFTVDRCTAVITNGGDLTGTHVILYQMCPMFEDIWSQHEMNGTHFHFHINTFAFIQYSLNVTFHCHLHVCLKDSTGLGCVQKNQTRECARREDQLRTTRSDDGFPFKEVMVHTSLINFERKQTCKELKCPANSTCEETYPAHCRCDEGFLYRMDTEECYHGRKENTITRVTDVALEKPFVEAYYDTSSHEFLMLAREVEEHLTYYIQQYNQANNDASIIGVKVVAARPGSIILDIELLKSSKNVTGNQVLGALIGALHPNHTTTVGSSNKTTNGTSFGGSGGQINVGAIAAPRLLGVSIKIHTTLNLPKIFVAVTTTVPTTTIVVLTTTSAASSTLAQPTPSKTTAPAVSEVTTDTPDSTTAKPTTATAETTTATLEPTTTGTLGTDAATIVTTEQAMTATEPTVVQETTGRPTTTTVRPKTVTAELTTITTPSVGPTTDTVIPTTDGLKEKEDKIDRTTIIASVVPSLAVIIICFIIFVVVVHRRTRNQFSWNLFE